MEIVSAFKEYVQKTISSFKDSLKSIRTGRATPALVDGLQVTAYNGTTTLKLRELTTITTEGPQTIVIVPFDPSTIPDIEKAFQVSTLGLNPAVQGNRLIIRVPALSEEQREKYVKLCGQKTEEYRISIRGQRDESRRKIKAQFEKKEIPEDTKFRLEKEIDTESSKTMTEIDTIREAKETEIRSI